MVPITSLQRSHHRGNSSVRSIGIIISTGFMALMAIYFLIPLVWLAVATTKNNIQLNNATIFSLPHHLYFLDNLNSTISFDGGIFGRWYLNSAIFSSVTAFVSCLVSILCGYALSKYRFRLHRVLLICILISLLIPNSTLTVPIFLVVKSIGLINTYPGVIIPMIASPFGAYFMKVYIDDAIPDVLLNAARTDGAGEWRILWQIVIPCTLPGSATLFLIAFMGSWNNFFLPLLILNSVQLFPVTLGLQMFPDKIMGSFLSIFPMMVLFIFLRKVISGGILSGSLKM